MILLSLHFTKKAFVPTSPTFFKLDSESITYFVRTWNKGDVVASLKNYDEIILFQNLISKKNTKKYHHFQCVRYDRKFPKNYY